MVLVPRARLVALALGTPPHWVLLHRLLQELPSQILLSLMHGQTRPAGSYLFRVAPYKGPGPVTIRGSAPTAFFPAQCWVSGQGIPSPFQLHLPTTLLHLLLSSSTLAPDSPTNLKKCKGAKGSEVGTLM